MTDGRRRTLLVVEDNELNRNILAEILSPSYKVLYAENGKTGLELLYEYGHRISLVLLDIEMPVMNGYEFLRQVQTDTYFASLPIIVTASSDSTTDEIRCLENGASDFVSKPYSAELVLKRVESMIRLSEASAVLHKVEFDTLTGVYSKEFFFVHAAGMLEGNPDEEFDIVCCDIESFKVINDRHGVKKGDEVLSYVAEELRKCMPERSIFGRVSGDIFSVLVPHIDIEEHMKREESFRRSLPQGPVPNVVIRFGVYQKVDHSTSVQIMCDNAILALNCIKHHYGAYVAEYDETVRRKLIREQQIVDNMELALEQHQFQVYYQVKHDLKRNRTGGAEALVRWIHPELGFMNPGEFIPLFEQNGFITKLDSYMLNEVCRTQREWMDRGEPVIPISVNISRVDFDLPDLETRIAAVADRHGVPHDLIHLEVTESAYTDNPVKIIQVVNRLRKQGFRVELDDFGSGYSSLNVLTELVLDVLKLDMSLVRSIEQPRQRCILSHVLAMAESLNMEIVAEGVDNERQARELEKMNCTYVQGYLYARPMDREHYEAYMKKERESHRNK